MISVFLKYKTKSVLHLELSKNKDFTESNQLVDLKVVSPTRTYEVTGSLLLDYVNSAGQSQFIENLNEYNDYEFTVKVKGILTDSDLSIKATGELKDNSVVSPTDSVARSAAINKIIDDDRYKPAFLLTLGYQSAALRNELATLGDSIHAYVPYGITTEVNDASQILAAAAPINNSDNLLMMAPGDKNTSFAGFKVLLSDEIGYLRRVTQNKARGCEFAPVFGDRNGAVTSIPAVTLTKSVREKLLDSRINSVTRNIITGVTYLNKNKSTSTSDDVLSEEQNKRLNQKVNRDLDRILKQFLGEFNTIQTRSKVRSVIKMYFDNNIMNQVYTLASEPKIICDETNNTTAVIAANQLVVEVRATYNKSIYEVVLYHRAFDLNNE